MRRELSLNYTYLGPMPSPSGSLLKIVINNSIWLEPDWLNPLIVLDSIEPNTSAMVPGQLKAFIRHETNNRISGARLCAKDAISLLAYSERLRRRVPEFSTTLPIVIQYPLRLPAPAYLDCITNADEMSISWKVRKKLPFEYFIIDVAKVRNVSTCGYGQDSDTKRILKVVLIDLTRSLSLQQAPKDGIYMEDFISHIGPNAEAISGESITAAYGIKAFSTGKLRLALYLQYPHGGSLRRIMHHDFHVQISEAYVYNPTCRFLFIVNALTDNITVAQVREFIQKKLRMSVDISNLSLTGTFIDKHTKESILFAYRGKSIIIAGNSFNFFGKYS